MKKSLIVYGLSFGLFSITGAFIFSYFKQNISNLDGNPKEVLELVKKINGSPDGNYGNLKVKKYEQGGYYYIAVPLDNIDSSTLRVQILEDGLQFTGLYLTHHEETTTIEMDAAGRIKTFDDYSVKHSFREKVQLPHLIDRTDVQNSMDSQYYIVGFKTI